MLLPAVRKIISHNCLPTHECMTGLSEYEGMVGD